MNAPYRNIGVSFDAHQRTAFTNTLTSRDLMNDLHQRPCFNTILTVWSVRRYAKCDIQLHTWWPRLSTCSHSRLWMGRVYRGKTHNKRQKKIRSRKKACEKQKVKSVLNVWCSLARLARWMFFVSDGRFFWRAPRLDFRQCQWLIDAEPSSDRITVHKTELF